MEFCNSLAAETNANTENQQVISLTEYGAQGPKERLKATLDALYDAIYKTGALREDSETLALQIYNELSSYK